MKSIITMNNFLDYGVTAPKIPNDMKLQQPLGCYLDSEIIMCNTLYGDFSGAMDIVIGIAQMFGIKMDENFQRPYFSISITDFWHRWHITLGTWMKDYLFYPLTFRSRELHEYPHR